MVYTLRGKVFPEANKALCYLKCKYRKKQQVWQGSKLWSTRCKGSGISRVNIACPSCHFYAMFVDLYIISFTVIEGPYNKRSPKTDHTLYFGP